MLDRCSNQRDTLGLLFFMESQIIKFKNKHLSKESRCHYCFDLIHESKCEVDHVIPKSKGGTSKLENLVLACRQCNRMKADYSLDELISKARKIVYYHG